MSIARQMMMAAAGGAGGGSGWVTDLANASYDEVSLLLAGEAVPSALVFNADGSKLYYVGYVSDRVRSYSMSVPFDLTTAVSDGVTFLVSDQENQPRGLAFNSDGSKMYIVGQSNDTVFQYSLSTPGDIATASYDSVSFSVAAQDTTPHGVTFSSDGSKMYTVGQANDTVFQYSLSTPFDLSSASYDSVSFSVAAQESAPTSVVFNLDGSKMYVVGGATDTVYQYSTV